MQIKKILQHLPINCNLGSLSKFKLEKNDILSHFFFFKIKLDRMLSNFYLKKKKKKFI
jgi:hypothetical protein